MITKKRADFEHQINARGCRPSAFAQYAEYEMNLESLRRKRVQRLGASVNQHAGQRRIFFILDRATRKFHGDLALWMQYAEYARKEKATRRFMQILTTVLRLHPTKTELWVYAAKYAMEVQGDMTAARAYLHRGLKFCRSSRDLWLEYTRLEMIYIAKLEGRRRVLGLELEPEREPTGSSRNGDADARIDIDAQIHAADAGETEPRSSSADPSGQQTSGPSPALAGAIPLAIFKAAMKQFPGDEGLARQYFDVIAEFLQVSCTRRLLEHISETLVEIAPKGSLSLSCYFRLPSLGVDVQSAAFPAALRTSFERLRDCLERTSYPAGLAEEAIHWLLSLLDTENLDESIRSALTIKLRQTIHQLKEAANPEGSLNKEKIAALRHRLGSAGYRDAAKLLEPGRPPD